MPVKFTQWTCFHRTPVCILVLLPPVITLWDLPSYPPPVMPADTIFPPTQTYNLSSGAQTYGFSYSFHSKTSYIWSETNLSLLFSLAPLQLSLFLTLTRISWKHQNAQLIQCSINEIALYVIIYIFFGHWPTSSLPNEGTLNHKSLSDPFCWAIILVSLMILLAIH